LEIQGSTPCMATQKQKLLITFMGNVLRIEYLSLILYPHFYGH
jgi:hypothetical protein